MTEETQALVLQLREWVDGQSVTYASVLMQDAAAALTALARDLETADRRIAGLTQASDGLLEQLGVALSDLAAARQERDAALEMARRVGESGDHHIQMALDGRTREREAVDAAVRAARAETTKAPRMHCASCGATEFTRLYTGGGDLWLHPADAEDSAACGPVYFAAREGQ